MFAVRPRQPSRARADIHWLVACRNPELLVWPFMRYLHEMRLGKCRAHLLYFSYPDHRSNGAGVATVLRQSLPRRWRLYAREAAVSRPEFDKYLAGVESGSALILRDVSLL